MVVCVIQSEGFRRGASGFRAFLANCIQQVEADLYVLPELCNLGFSFASGVAAEARSSDNWKDWQALAENVPEGRTCLEIRKLLSLSRPNSSVVCGLLEVADGAFYNSAVVVGSRFTSLYRQSVPARTTTGVVLPIGRGAFTTIPLTPERNGRVSSIGPMICSDDLEASTAFALYRERKADLVVLIADSVNRGWLRIFPDFCRRFQMPAVVCDAAGEGRGGSMAFDRDGQFLPMLVNGDKSRIVLSALGGIAQIATAHIPLGR